MFMFRDDATGKSSLEVTRLGVVSRLVRLSERAPMTDDLPWRGTQGFTRDLGPGDQRRAENANVVKALVRSRVALPRSHSAFDRGERALLRRALLSMREPASENGIFFLWVRRGSDALALGCSLRGMLP